MAERLVAVLGYSGRHTARLHPICAARLAHAQRLAGDGETVLLSGWARRNGGTSEADLMRAAWQAPGVELVSDRTSGSTAGNAVNIASAVAATDARELVVVTSRWHRPRARILFRSALRGQGVQLSVEGAPGPRPPGVIARELVCLASVPFQLWRLGRIARADVLQRRAGGGDVDEDNGEEEEDDAG